MNVETFQLLDSEKNIIFCYIPIFSNHLFVAAATIISRLTSMDEIHRYLKILFDHQIQLLTQVDNSSL